MEVGTGVSTLRTGDKVTGDTVEGCGICDKCKLGINPNFCTNPTIHGFQTSSPGAFAQFVVRKESNLHRLPPGMTHEQGCLAEPLSVAYHAVWQIGGGVRAGEDVVIFGAGPIGLLVLSVVKASGARAISIDPVAFRRELALDLGADEVVDPYSLDPTEEVMRLTDGVGADLVFEATASDDARSRILDVAETTGRIVMIGQAEMKKLPIELEKVVVKGLTIRGSAGSPNMIPPALKFMSRSGKDLTAIISHRFPLERGSDALELATARAKSEKIVLTD